MTTRHVRLMSALLLCLCAHGSAAAGGASVSAGLPARPQEPREPHAYAVEDVRFGSGDTGAALAGTLTMPSGGRPVAAVLLLSGAGFQDRCETLYGHQPLKVLADRLTRKGLAVLRVDDRSTGAATSDDLHATPESFAADALAGVRFLAARPGIDSTRIGLVGHAEGALSAAIVAAQFAEVSFVVMLAGLGIRWDENAQLAEAERLGRLETSQEVTAASLELNERIFAAVRAEPAWKLRDAAIRGAIVDWRASLAGDAKLEFDHLSREHPDCWNRLAERFAQPQYRYYLNVDPRLFIRRVTCPVLALWGGQDTEVIPEPNLMALEAALRAGGNRQYAMRVLPELNHLFQHSTTGLAEEYAVITETFAPDAMDLIADWILARMR